MLPDVTPVVSGDFRLLFVTDLHGSNECFKKLLNLAQDKEYPADVVVVGGDISGKRLHLLFETTAGESYLRTEGKDAKLPSTVNDVKARITALEEVGDYVECVSRAEADLISYSEEKFNQVYIAATQKRLTAWLKLAGERLKPLGIPIIINTGNDDPVELNKLISDDSYVIYPESEPLLLNSKLALLSVGYSNDVPWDCPKKETEEQLNQRISVLVDKCIHKFPKVGFVFNFHCPPYGTEIDFAMVIDRVTKRPKLSATGPVVDHVGSTAVRDAIAKFSPKISLHGHIHEAHGFDNIGNTRCVTPGSEYFLGKLHACLVEFDANGEFERCRMRWDATPHTTGIISLLKDAVMQSLPGPFGKARHNRHVDEKLSAIEEKVEAIESRFDRLEEAIHSLVDKKKD